MSEGNNTLRKTQNSFETDNLKSLREKDLREKDLGEKDLKEKDLKEKDRKRKDVKQKDEKEKSASDDINISIELVLIFIVLFIFTIITHIIKPACTLLEIIYLTRFIKIKTDPLKPYSSYIGKSVKIIGWLIIFALPLVNFFITGIKIISIQNRLSKKFYVTFVCLIEVIFQFPLTFLYYNNLYSIFLFEQRGYEQLLSPWIIFFPSDYLLSYFENIRQLIDSIYFLIIGFIAYKKISGNKYEAFNIHFLMIMNVLCILRIVTALALILMKIIKGDSRERVNKLLEENKIKELKKKIDEEKKNK